VFVRKIIYYENYPNYGIFTLQTDKCRLKTTATGIFVETQWQSFIRDTFSIEKKQKTKKTGYDNIFCGSVEILRVTIRGIRDLQQR